MNSISDVKSAIPDAQFLGETPGVFMEYYSRGQKHRARFYRRWQAEKAALDQDIRLLTIRVGETVVVRPFTATEKRDLKNGTLKGCERGYRMDYYPQEGTLNVLGHVILPSPGFGPLAVYPELSCLEPWFVSHGIYYECFYLPAKPNGCWYRCRYEDPQNDLTVWAGRVYVTAKINDGKRIERHGMPDVIKNMERDNPDYLERRYAILPNHNRQPEP